MISMTWETMGNIWKQGFGGGDEIRTHGTTFAVRSLSKRVPSTTRPPLRKHALQYIMPAPAKASRRL